MMTSQKIRCPSCARLLVLRSGPAITTHFAHRPRQSCRNRPGRSPARPVHLEQLTLFELEPLAPPAPAGRLAGFAAARANRPGQPSAGFAGAEVAPTPVHHPARRRRPRRRAWLPRLIRWLKGQSR
jgi:hypothetical protein